MELAELRAAVEGTLATDPYKKNMEVRVAASHYGPQVGGVRTVAVRSAYEGIDWDSGRFTIYPDIQLYQGLDEMQKAANFAHHVRELVWDMRRDTGRMRYSNFFKSVVEGLDAWLPERNEKED